MSASITEGDVEREIAREIDRWSRKKREREHLHWLIKRQLRGNMEKEAGEPILPQKDGKLWSSGAGSHHSVWIPVFVWHLWCLTEGACACASMRMHLIGCHIMLMCVQVSAAMLCVWAASPGSPSLQCSFYLQQIPLNQFTNTVSIWLVDTNKFFFSLLFLTICISARGVSRTEQCTSVQLIRHYSEITGEWTGSDDVGWK